jgi:hypothetical protein
MLDFIDQYRRIVQKRLVRKEDEPIVKLADALCFPSCHPEVLATWRFKGEWAGKWIVPAIYYDFAWTPSKVKSNYVVRSPVLRACMPADR